MISLQKFNDTYYIFFFLCIYNLAFSQTDQWRVIWDRNPDIDSVAYYTVYRKVNAIPGVNDSIGYQNQTAGASIDSVVFVDKAITKGRRYVYSVVAVDSQGQRSGFSATADAAIPEIVFNTLTLLSGSTNTVDLKSSQYVNDPDHNYSQLKWAVSGGNQISISINATTNVAAIITPEDTTVTEQFEFTVTDPDGFFDQRQVTITLTSPPVNHPPQFTSFPDTSASAGEEYQYNAIASDPDGDVLRFFLQQGPAFLNVQKLTNTSALLTGTPAISDTGLHDIVLAVTDEIATVTQSFLLKVIGIAPPLNNPPAFTSTPDTSASAGEEYQYTAIASDPDGDVLRFFLQQGPAFLNVQKLTNTSASLTGTPAISDTGIHDIVLAVTDEIATVRQSFVLKVIGIAPPLNNPPAFTSTPDTSATVMGEYKYTVQAVDADGDVLRFLLQTGPQFLELQKLTNTSALLSGTPDTSDVGTHPIVLAVTDEFVTITQSFILTVKSNVVPPLAAGGIKPYPMPFQATQHSEIRFTNLPDGGSVSILNLLGEPVFQAGNVTSDFAWKVVNDEGKNINAGLYIYYINNKGGEKVGSGKLVVVK